jgi:hypothetical protein
MTRDSAPLRVRLDRGLADGRSVVARLNETRGLAEALLDGDILVIRPTRQPMMAGMPVYYDGRPEFRGKLMPEAGGRVILRGFVQHSRLPAFFNLVGGLVAAFGAMFGATMLLSGDLTGVAVILGAAITGVAALVGTVLFRRLSRMDEQAIMSALRAIADDAQLT